MAKTNSKPKTVPDEIGQLRAQISQLEDSWKRALADYQNLLRRVESDKKEFVKMSNANLIARLIPSLDIIELSASHNPADIGIEMAAKQFHQALKEEGLESISPSVGDNFDPAVHECAETIDLSEGKTENTISEIIVKGYRLGDYVLRPAKVKAYRRLNQSN